MKEESKEHEFQKSYSITLEKKSPKLTISI